jgi:uncharacterized protein (DUF2141 family)
LVFYIDEWFEQKSFEKAFFISPEPEVKPKFKYGLHKVEVVFKGGFDTDKTYVVTIGAGFSDLVRNPMEKSYTFAFSTGYYFAKGVVQGKVQGGKGGMITALYNTEDDFNISEDKGEYLTQTDKTGIFTFGYISPGAYRLIVFDDADGNRLYNPGREKLGLCWQDIVVNEDTSLIYNIKTTERSANPPSMIYVEPWDRHKIVVNFDRDLENFPSFGDVSISDTMYQEKLSVKNVFPHPLAKNKIFVYVDTFDSIYYNMIITGGADSMEMVVNDTITFRASCAPDTIPPHLLKISSEGDSSFKAVEIITDELIDETKLPVESEKPCQYILMAKEIFSGDSVSFNCSSLADMEGNVAPDSIVTFVVSRKVKEKFSEDTGSISGIAQYEGGKPLVIIMKGKDKEIFKSVQHSPGAFSFAEAPAGYYRFEAFIDADEDGRYDYGRIEPFKFAERFMALEDSFRVRSKWETSGVMIKFQN